MSPTATRSPRICREVGNNSRSTSLSIALILGLILLPWASAHARYASIVIDVQTGEVLHAINADTRNYPASLVKMMTLYTAFEALEQGRLKLEQDLKVSRRAAGMTPSRLGLKAGSTIRAEDAILAMVTKSANDAAVVLAEAMGKNEMKFASMMTKKARALGMKRTRFRNASGLPNRRQLSTARDLATLGQALMRDFPQYYHLFSTREFTYDGNGRTYKNHNRLLERYEGTDGIKTGYTRASGFNLAASVEREGRRLIAVVLGGKSARSRDRHISKLLDRGFTKVARLADQESFKSASGNSAERPSFNVKTAYRAAAKAKTVAKMAISKSSASHSSIASYSVQVGAYYGYHLAKRAAAKAAQLVPELLSNSRAWISQIKGKKRRIFLARLVGLSKSQANQACLKLRSENMDCLAVKLSNKVQVALNKQSSSSSVPY